MDKHERIGTFCEKCRNPMCICNKGKTAKQWFTEYFPEPLRSEAIVFATNSKVDRVYCISLTDAIDKLYWASIHEVDQKYWYRIRCNYSTPLTESPMPKFTDPPKAPKQKTIYDMELHEWINIDQHTGVMRVPGGWHYHYKTPHPIILFVPFNNEFK